ncbi:uncharacterized protein LOC114726437 [Neltuma alba]|uniref:uncharacterized protein LOC114726437 n=1 Tax=Neltuma alba TaxID=207710 RepID=UPI0010A460F6|nr:uncharacterized protein LOC114726437 [Prosopis alba]
MVRERKHGEGGSGKTLEEPDVDLIWKQTDVKTWNGGTLAGKMITEKNLNPATTIQMIRKGWNLVSREDLEIVEINRKAFIFNFKRREEALRILRGRPWSINGCLLNIQKWNDDMLFDEVDFNYCPFWIQFHDLPPAVIDIENAIRLGEKIGEVVLVENPKKNDLMVRNFLRVRVLVDLRKPLISGLRSPRPGKEPMRIKVRYERLQNFCFACGKIGHDLRSCPEKRDEDAYVEIEYGSWLGIQAARWMEEAIKPCKEDWEELGGRGMGRMLKRVELVENKKNKENVEKTNSESGSGSFKVDTTRAVIEDEGSRKSTDLKKEQSESGDQALVVSEKLVKKEVREKVQTEMEKERAEVSKNSESENINKAIIVYGSISPMSEVTKGLEKVGLKRKLEEEGTGAGVKKRRLDFEHLIDEIAPVQVNTQTIGARKSVRMAKRQSKRRGRIRREEIEHTESRMICCLDMKSPCVKGGDIAELGDIAGGYGGWPSTATKEP